jgi:hypothetical protein
MLRGISEAVGAVSIVGRMSVFEAGDLVLCLLIGVAFIVVVCRANRDDLPAIVRAIMRIGTPADSQTMSIRRTGSV